MEASSLWHFFFSLELLFLIFIFVEPKGGVSSSDFYREKREDKNIPWSYSGDTGPKNWAKIGYKDCDGHMQSPIILDREKAQSTYTMERIEYHGFNKKRSGMILSNVGTSVTLEVPGDDKLYIDHGGLNSTFTFHKLYFHFGKDKRSGALHKIIHVGDTASTMEMDLYHINEDGDGAVLSFLFRETQSEKNENFVPIIKNLGQIRYKGESTKIKAAFSLGSLLPPPKNRVVFFRYMGSLPVPPCSENVVWSVYQYIIPIGPKQMEQFRKLFSTPEGSSNPQKLYGNFRPLQPVNGREIKYVISKEVE